ncbi:MULTISPECIES: DUF3093 domain-containing protein [unclassified Plantibacter]|jgi:hypothetical protein|uniref:DUF3093 domain-containing protein n=1 Tax=unclassified Plantibacter TaxID=2624265 RepID=UPI003D32FF20
MQPYRETLWPSFWVFAALALVIPATMLVLAPVSLAAGVIGAVVLYGGCVGLALIAAPRIEVTADTLRAGKASIPIDRVGETTEYVGVEAQQQRGPRLDARAWLLIRGWVSPMVKVAVVDDDDPTPYWLLSTRYPDRLAAAIAAAKEAA